MELERGDPEGIFRFAIRQFSAYPDVRLDRVLAPPTPDDMVASPIQPRILGVPDVPKDMKIVMSPYFAKITGASQLTRNSEGEYGLTLTISNAGIDWKETGDRLESTLDLTISFINEKTREKRSFSTGLKLTMPKDKFSNLYNPIKLNDVQNHSSGMEGTTLSDLFKKLPPGDYEIKIFLINQITPRFSLKSGIWYEYVTISK